MRNEVVQSSFSNKLLEVLDHIEYRRVETQEDMEEVARMRYRAYKLANILTLDGAKLIDAVDFDDHAYVFGVYFDERLISTVRIHHVTPDHRISITRDMYPKEIDAFLDSGMTLIDPVRFAAAPRSSVKCRPCRILPCGSLRWQPITSMPTGCCNWSVRNMRRSTNGYFPPIRWFRRKRALENTIYR